MSSDKQIDEMRKDVASIHRFFLEDDDYENLDNYIADMLFKKGYRKASEVAAEIFAEIDKRLNALLEFYPCNGALTDAKEFVNVHWKHIMRSMMFDYDAELKKKYQEGGE